LTVADVLATLHGEPEPETKTSTLRPHAFKPKHGSASRDKLREKIREHLTAEDHVAGEFADEDFESGHSRKETHPTEKPAPPRPAPAPPASDLPATRGTAHVRRVSRPRHNGGSQQLKPHPADEEQPRSGSNPNLQPVITAPRRRQRPQQNGGKIRQETEKSVPAPTGGRLLSDADLMTGLGFGKKDAEIEFIPTPAAPLVEDLEEDVPLEDDEDSEVEVDDKEAAPPSLEVGSYVPTIEDILKSAIVETSIPIAPEVLESTSIVPTPEPEPTLSLPVSEANIVLPKPEKVAATVPARGRTHVPSRHRLESSGQSTAHPPRQSAPIESRRVRTRQRVAAATTPAPESVNGDEPALEESSQKPADSSRQNSRQVTRVRQPIRNHTSRVASEFPVSSGRPRAGSGHGNVTRQPNKVNNNKLRVRGGSRSTTPPTVAGNLEDDAFTLTVATEAAHDGDEIFVPDYDIGNVLGKLDDYDEDGESTNTDKQVDPVSAEDEESEFNAVSADLDEDDEEIANEPEPEKAPRKFAPKFGEKQRKSVRSKLKSQLFEHAPGVSTESSFNFDGFSDGDGDDDEPDFQSVSPSEGLSSVPATFFTTTSRFDLLTENNFENFLPTHKPRIGRSTVGYGKHINEVTEKPELFTKLGVSEYSVRGDILATTETIEVVTTTTAAATTTTITPDETVTPAAAGATTTTDKLGSVENEASTDEDIGKPAVEVGARLSKRKKTDFLYKLSEKVLADREEKEKKLLNSFAESHSRITTRLPADDALSTLSPDESSKRPPVLSSFVRPRRKFEIGAKVDKEAAVVEVTTEKLNETSTDDVTSKKSNETSTDDVTNETSTDDVTTEKSADDVKTEKSANDVTAKKTSDDVTTKKTSNDVTTESSSLLPTPRPLPKDLKLPFGKKGFKPALLAFTVEKKSAAVNASQLVENESVASSTSPIVETATSASLVEDKEENSKISSLKRKFQFGRKAFGKLLSPKGPEVNSSQPSTSSTTTSTTSSPPEPYTPAPDVLLTSPEFSRKVFK